MSEQERALYDEALDAWQQYPVATAATPPHSWAQDFILARLAPDVELVQQQIADMFKRTEAT